MKKKIAIKGLGNKLSQLLIAAGEDMIKLRKDKRYRFNMGQWHMPVSANTCEGCLAGSVLACRSDIKPGEKIEVFTQDFNAKLTATTARKMAAINQAREGGVDAALRELLGYNEGGALLNSSETKRHAVNKARNLICAGLNYEAGHASPHVYIAAGEILAGAGL